MCFEGVSVTVSTVSFWLRSLCNDINIEALERGELIFLESVFFAAQVVFRFTDTAHKLEAHCDNICALKIVKDFIMNDVNHRGMTV